MGNYHARFYEGLGRGDTPSLLSSGNCTKLTYDSLDQEVNLQELFGNTVTETQQFVWSDGGRSESRDGAGNSYEQYFRFGQKSSGANFYGTLDHLGSVRELTDSDSSVQATYHYDPFGTCTETTIGATSAMRYSSHYYHVRSKLLLTPTREYSSSLGRWLSRDKAQTKLFVYVNNNPISFVDNDGRFPDLGKLVTGIGYHSYDTGLDIGSTLGVGMLSAGIYGQIAQNIANQSGLDGQAKNAYLHCLWSAMLASQMGSKYAQTITDNHEAAGKQFGQSSGDEQMDQCNNKKGRCVGSDHNNDPKTKCMELLLQGQLCGQGGNPQFF